MRKAFADPEFPKEFHKLTGNDPAPLGGEELKKAIKELPRDKEVVQLSQKLAEAIRFGRGERDSNGKVTFDSPSG